MSFSIIHGNIKQVFELSNKIPEFETPYPVSEYDKRLKDRDPVVLVAIKDDVEAGFKVGYNRYNDGSFYSWMGGVLPAYRRNNIASVLNIKMEQIATSKGYKSLKVKTLNKHQDMLFFLLKKGYHIIGYEEGETLERSKILFEKTLIK